MIRKTAILPMTGRYDVNLLVSGKDEEFVEACDTAKEDNCLVKWVSLLSSPYNK